MARSPSPGRHRAAAHLATATLLLASLGADATPWSWGGFGTLSAYRPDAPGARARPDVLAPRLADSGAWRWDGDSRLGVQGRWSSSETLEWVGQVEAADDERTPWQPRLSWAYLGYRPLPGLSLRLGRQVLPTLYQSETRNVGYAQASVRPPAGPYTLNPGTPVDGLNATWEQDLSGGTLRMDLGGGRASVVRAGQRIDLRSSLSGTVQWQREALRLRASVNRFHIDLAANPLAALAASGVCTNCEALIAQRVGNRGIRGSLYSALVAWEAPDWQASVEGLHRPASGSVLTPAAWGWSALLSRRLGAWQPHVAVSEFRYLERPLGLQIRPDAPAAVVAQGAAIDRLLQSRQDLRIAQIGMRWDFAEGLAAKLQVERWTALRDRETGRSGLVGLAAPPLAAEPSGWNGRVRLTTLSLDFVF